MANPVLVICGETVWTQQAVHLASALAREDAAPLVLILMSPTPNALYLGDGERETLLSLAQVRMMDGLAAIAASYGVAVGWQVYEYNVYVDGVVDAAQRLNAAAIFAPAPSNRIGALARLRLRWLRHSLHRPLFTLGPEDAEFLGTPTDSARSAPVSVGART